MATASVPDPKRAQAEARAQWITETARQVLVALAGGKREIDDELGDAAGRAAFRCAEQLDYYREGAWRFLGEEAP